MENRASTEVEEESASVFVDGYEDVRIGAESDGGDVLAVLEWESVRLVATNSSIPFCSREYESVHLRRSKTETRLPIGLRIALPSEVKRTFPCW